MPMMTRLMTVAASRLPKPSAPYSSASKDNVVVSRDASKMIVLVVPDVMTKLNIAMTARVGVSNGIQIVP